MLEVVFKETSMLSFDFKKFAQDETGATLVEYGIAVVLAVLVGTAGLLLLGQQIDNNMTSAAMRMDPANN